MTVAGTVERQNGLQRDLREDAELLRRAAAGDERAVASIYDRYADHLYRLAFRLTESSADAQDIVQDVFLGLPEAIQAYRATGDFERWIKKTTVRTAMMKLRSEKRRREVSLTGLAHLFEMHGHHDRVVVDRLTLERAISRLPEEFRHIIVLKEIEGFSHREIGELLGITEGTSSVRYSRAMKALRKILRSQA